MEENEFLITLVGALDEKKSKKQITSDIKELEKVLRNLRLTATLAKGDSKKNLNQAVKQLEGQLNHIKLQAKIDQKNLKADVNNALQNISFKDIDIGVDTGKTKLKVQKAIADVKKIAGNNPITVNVELKKGKLNNDLTTYLSKNSRVRESEPLLKEADKLREKIAGINDKDSLRNVTQEFQLFKSECSATGYQAKSASDHIKNLLGNVTKLGSALGVASMAVSNYQKSLQTIRKNDEILTEISKTSNATKQELEELGNEAFDTASKFGKVSSDYLTAIQEMNRSGFYGEAGKALGELTLLTQAAGDVTADVAQEYLLATNAAYGYAGSVEKLTAVLDGQNKITNSFSVDMETMATATEKAGSVAANAGVKIEELSAMIGTISSRTKEAGATTGTGIKSLLINLQNASSSKIVGTLEKANASMTKIVDGAQKLRTPIAILKDLAKTYNSLEENDPLKSEITTNIGGKYHANQLSALLSGWADFEQMLTEYSNGAGSALEEADKSANNLTGRLNALQNTWDELVNSITSKSTIKGGVSFLDNLLQSVTKLVETFDVLPVALAGVTAFMTAKNKDYGLKFFDDKGSFDLSGNFMGIVNVDQIKHFKEAENAIAGWNKKLKLGQTDINDFGEDIVKNNSQLRNYLSTCTDGSASLKGYKASLQAAGIETNSLRLGTILLNTALSFGLGFAIQGVIAGLDYLIHKEEKMAEALANAKSKFTGTVDEIKSLNDELTSTQDKIAELQKLADNGTISVADENELKLLKETNDELERKIALKQKEQIDDAKELLKNVQKNNEEKPYSYAHYNSEGRYVTERKQGDASEQLQDMIIQYQDALKHFGKDNVNVDNYNETISKQAEKVGTLVDAYKSLEDAGMALTEEQREEYNAALQAQDAYLLYSYNLNKTKEGFRALGEEQQRSILHNKLLEQGLSDIDAKAVLKEISKEDLDDYYDLDFNFPLPDRNSYKTVEEYGKAYANAWKDGVKEEIEKVDKQDIITSISDALAQSNGTEDGTWADNINDYKEKLSSLQSYLDKLRDGNYTPEDLATLAEKFNIIGDTAEERITKIANLMQEETKKAISIIDGIISSGKVDEATMKDLTDFKGVLQDICDVGISGNGFQISGNALADVQSLSEGLDQLDKVYADILDKEDFDFSSVFSADFKKEFGAYTDEYNKFIETVTSSPDDLNACQEAFNNLASAYIHGSGVLDEVTESTKASCIAMLEQMGVANAAAIVEQALAKNEEVRKYAEEAVAAATSDMSGKTKHASKKLLEQATMSETARKALFDLVSQQTIFANQDLGLHEKITGLQQLATAYMGVKKAAVFQEAFDRNMALNASGARHGKKELSVEEVFQKTIEQVFDDVFPKVQEVKISYTGGTTTRDTAEKLAKETEDKNKKDKSTKEQTAQEFDWIEVKLNSLIDAASKAKDKIDDLLTFGAKKKQTQKAIEATTKAIEAQYKAIKQYSAYADITSGKAEEKASIAAAKELAEAATNASDTVASTVSGVMSGAVDTSVGVVQDALQYVGKLPYVWGGASLTTGADCSGFVQQLYKKYGVNIPHYTESQLSDPNGMNIYNQADLQPGDLVFFNGYLGQGRAGHVGLYIGNGQFVHEPKTGETAKVQPLSSRSDFVAGKRYAGISGTSSTLSTTGLPSVSSTSASQTDTMSIQELQKYQKIWTSIPENIKKNIREGSFSIESITDEGLKAGIASYQEWWDKVKACKDKIEELNRTLKELYQTMANLPLEKRDQKAGNMEQRIGLIDATRENVDDVIVSRNKYRKTKKEVRTARKDVRKGLRTKQQKASSGLNKTERRELDSYMKSGKEIPDRLLNSILDSDLYETCREYNDAVSNHAQYTKTSLTAKASIKKYNSLTRKAISAERSKEKVYKKTYKETSRNYAKSLGKVSASGASVKKAVQNGQSGLTKAKADKILSYIKEGKLIPSGLFAQIDQTSSFAQICREYNEQVVNKDASREALKNAKLDYQKQAQDTKQQVRSRKIERQQNAADKIQSKMERNEALAENESNSKKKNKYLEKNISLTKEYYRHLIRIARLEGDSAEVEKLKAERKKAVIDLKAEEFQNYADDANSRIERNNALIDNTRSASEKNKYLKENISLIQEEYDWRIKIAKLRGDEVEAERLAAEKQKELNDTFRQQFQNNADEHAAKMDYLQLKQENATDATSKNSFEQARRDEMRKKYSSLRLAAFDDPQEQLRLDEELQAELNKSFQTEFDNISNYYSNLISLISNDISDIDNEIKKVEASGRKVDASFYQAQIAQEEKKLAYYHQEKESLTEQLANLRMGTDEWYKAQDALQSVQDAEAESLAAIKQYKDEINAIADAIQEDILKGFHAITDEADLLITLLGDNFTDDKEGIFTDDGLAALSLYVTQLNVCRTAADELRKNVDAMQTAIDNNQLSFLDANGVKREYASVDEMKEKLQDMYATYRDEVKHTYDYESKIIGLMKEKYQAESDWLKDLIDKKKEALNAEKDLYEYSKTIKQQTDNIDSLRKQIAALKGDTSIESEARVQKLQAQLKDAEEGLKDTEYDRYISDQQNMLDNMYNEYSTLLTELEKNHDKLLQEGLDLFAQTGSDVQDTIRDTADQYNYRMTLQMDSITTAIQGMGSMETYLGTEGTVTKTLSDIAFTIKNVYTALSSKVEDADTSNIGKSEEHQTDKSFIIPPYTEPIKFKEIGDAFGKEEPPVIDAEDKRPPLSDIITELKPGGIGLDELSPARKSKKAIKKLLESGTKTYNGNGSSLNNYIYKKYGTALTVSEMAKLAQSLGMDYTVSDLSDSNQNNNKYKKNILAELKALGLAKGGVVTHGKKLEDYGLRNASGGTDEFPVILTEGERVLTPVQNTMWEKWTQAMPDLMDLAPKIDSIAKMPEPKTNNAATNVKIDYGNVSINLPNVKNYPDFMRQAQKDPDFSKLIGHIMNTHLSGAGSFGKFNVRF